jgi:hypothetical protein
MMVTRTDTQATDYFDVLPTPGSLARVNMLTGLFLLVLCIQAVANGLLGEMMVFLQDPTHSRYLILQRIN